MRNQDKFAIALMLSLHPYGIAIPFSYPVFFSLPTIWRTESRIICMVANFIQHSHLHRQYGMISLIEMLVQQLITTIVNLKSMCTDSFIKLAFGFTHI